jgi:hypothetical protein
MYTHVLQVYSFVVEETCIEVPLYLCLVYTV